MSAAQHTPGPWEVLDHEGVHVLAEGGLTIATVAHQLNYARIEGRTQIQNARLIAAAPEMLAALLALMSAYYSADTPEGADVADYEAALSLAGSAIAKATGGAS